MNILHKFSRVLAFVILLFWAFFSLLPFFWMFTVALTPGDYLDEFPPQVNPENWSFQNFIGDPTDEDIKGLLNNDVSKEIWNWFFNSFLVASIVTVSNVFFSTLAGYTFAKMKFWGRKFLFWIFLATMMVPAQVILVPLFLMINNLGLYDTHWAIILPVMTTPMGIFLMRQFIKTFPVDLIDAARMDGASEPLIFFKLIIPMAKPGMAVLAILTFMGQWKNFLWPLIVLDSNKKYTLEVGLATLRFFQGTASSTGVLFAGAIFSAVPMIIMFFIFQKYLIDGLTVGGALKG